MRAGLQAVAWAAVLCTSITLVAGGLLPMARAAGVSHRAQHQPASSAGVSPSFATGFMDPFVQPTSGFQESLGKMQAAGSSFFRLLIGWSSIESASSPPANPSDPNDPAYDWTVTDQEVQAVVKAGLEPIFDIVFPPSWAVQPDPTGAGPGVPIASDLGAFAAAAATRYSGTFDGLPRVRYWQVWNEPNLTPNLSPQLVNDQPVAVYAYRDMVNAVAQAVKGVAPDNVVIGGGLAPFFDNTPIIHNQDSDWGPLAFMRAFFCLSPSLKATCHVKIDVDAWSMHPYTSGGPTHHAVLPNDVSLGDLAKVNAVLAAAVRAGNISSGSLPQLWVTEFSWDSNPPDPNGVPTSLLKRWVPQGLYQMWKNGVRVLTWFSLDDQPLATSPYQSGFYYTNGRPKPYLEGFRFPVVAFPRGHGFYVWGSTPPGVGGPIHVQQRVRSSWRTIATISGSGNHVFQATLNASRTGWVRARILRTGETSLPFSLKAVPDKTYIPFGLSKPLEPHK